MTKVLFMGRKPVAAKCLEQILSRSDVEVVAVLTDDHLQVSPTSEVARKHDVPLLRFEEALEACETGKLSFDFGVSMLYWRKLRGALLSAAPRGIVNFHPAPLPDYKGVGGYNLAILNCRDEWACTAHYVDEEIDTGEIIMLNRFPMDPETETAQTLEAKSQTALFDLFNTVFDQLVQTGNRLPTSANEGGQHLNRKELEAMKRIDPEKDDPARKARAFWFPPYDGAFVEINGQKFTIVDRCILESLADRSSSSIFTPSARLEQSD
jgi:methionyl-tRNA formyltransferase